MLTPPFKRSAGLAALGSPSAAAPGRMSGICCDHDGLAEPALSPIPAPAGRAKLHQMEPHLHCSIIGTCLGTGELRKLMARLIAVKGLSDLEVHHLAVSQAGLGGDVSKALHKALDQRHAGALRIFAAAQDEAALDAIWQQAWAQGDIPGAYWALMTHKAASTEQRQEAFGEVHMLSHLMGSAHRHELKRFVALEKENAELRERLEREQLRRQEALQARDELTAQLHRQLLAHECRVAELRAAQQPAPVESGDWVTLQTQRREQAERWAEEARAHAQRLQDQLEHLQSQGRAMAEELAAAEAELQQLSAAAMADHADAKPQAQFLQSRRVLYVGGRPSSTPAIRDYVQRHGGEFLHHDGGLESRKGLLAALLPRADVVMFPVDCVDHDSVSNLKRLSERHQVPFVALRSASLASFAASVRRELFPTEQAVMTTTRLCLRHG